MHNPPVPMFLCIVESLGLVSMLEAGAGSTQGQEGAAPPQINVLPPQIQILEVEKTHFKIVTK